MQLLVLNTVSVAEITNSISKDISYKCHSLICFLSVCRNMTNAEFCFTVGSPPLLCIETILPYARHMEVINVCKLREER